MATPANPWLWLGWLAFGGPVGQIGLMHLQVVERRKWIEEDEFVRALNFCHVLPGPEALQLVIYIGWKKRGYLGGLLAGLLFILPGFLTLTTLAWVYLHHGNRPEVLGVLSGFRPVGLALLLAALVRISRATLKGAMAFMNPRAPRIPSGADRSPWMQRPTSSRVRSSSC